MSSMRSDALSAVPDRVGAPAHRSATALVALSAASFVGFLLLAGLVRLGRTTRLDAFGERVVGRLAAWWPEVLGGLLTDLGRVEYTLSAALGVALVLWWRRRRLSGAAVLLVFGTVVLEVAAKELLYVPLKDVVSAVGGESSRWPAALWDILARPRDAPYPSGHMARAVFLGGLLAWWVVARPRPWIVLALVWVGLALLLTLMGLTRIAEREHPFSDVIGGTLLAGALLPLAWWLLARDLAARRSSGPRR